MSDAPVRISVAICTSMRIDITALLEALAATRCHEILVIANAGTGLKTVRPFADNRLRLLHGHPDLANKRNIALREASGDVVAFIDDDAVPGPGWFDAMARGFSDPGVGIVTGPSILPKGSGFWQRVAQLAMASTEVSRPRYSFCRPGPVAWWAVIGANVAFRTRAILDEGGCQMEFSAQADEMIMSWKMEQAGWTIRYDPDVYVWHSPHPPMKQFSQVYKWGRGSVQLERNGAHYPPKDPAYVWFLPVYAWFCLLYAAGMLKEKLFPER